MFSLYFDNYYFLVTPIILIIYVWLFFFKCNVDNINIEKNVKINIKKIKNKSINLLNNLFLILTKTLLLSFFLIHGKNNIIFYNNVYLNNFTLFNCILFFFINYFISFILMSLKKTNLVSSTDYFFSVSNLLIIIPFLFFVNNLLIFLFFLELISIIILYKLVSSKIWFKKNKDKIKNELPQNYINMIFFQFWVTFFSTIFIIFFYINIFYMYGSTDFYLTQYLNNYLLYFNKNIHQNSIFWLNLIFFFGVVFKLGITPLHLFKIEIYKGIPFLSIFFYNVYFLLIFLFFFILLISDFNINFYINFYIIFFLFISIGFLYIIILMFDVNFLKSFFAYSTIVNSLGFIIIMVSSF